MYAIYYDALRRRIEERGTRNFPEIGGKKLYGELTMNVTVDHDGRVLDTEVVRKPPATSRSTAAPSPSSQRGGAVRPLHAGDAAQGRPDRVGSRFKFTREDTLETRLTSRMKTRAAMDRYCVIGNPVEHSKSPLIHAAFAAATGQPRRDTAAACARWTASPAAVRAFRRRRRRAAATSRCRSSSRRRAGRRPSARAALADAVQHAELRRATACGDNTDGIGLVRDIAAQRRRRAGRRRVLLIGAGGAAAGVLGPLLEARPRAHGGRQPHARQGRGAGASATPRWRCRTASRCRRGRCDDCGGSFDVVINATASSLAGGAVPVAADGAASPARWPRHDVRPGGRPVPATGPREHGARARDGLGMLVEQAAEAFLSGAACARIPRRCWRSCASTWRRRA